LNYQLINIVQLQLC